MRSCSDCKLELSEDKFYVKNKDTGRLDKTCKECRLAKNREYRSTNPDKYRNSKSDWDKRNKALISERRKERLKSLSEEEYKAHRERQNKNSERMRERRIKEYFDSHESAPTCECGCGNVVNFDAKGKPYRFINGHQASIAIDATNKRFKEQGIPINVFREAVRGYCQRHGLSLAAFARKAGCEYKYLHELMYKKTRRYVPKVYVEQVNARLEGRSRVPTQSEKQRIQKSLHTEAVLESHYNIR
jgi:hypothetical protein